LFDFLAVSGYNTVMLNRYLGKILAVIRQDGLFGGVKIAFRMFFALVYNPRSADVLFVSSGAIGDSWRYRVKNVAEELKLHGISSSIVVQENIWLDSYADKFKIFIFHRVSHTSQVVKLIDRIKKENKEIIFETDDLLFDPALIKDQDFFKNSNALVKKFYEHGVGGEILDDLYVKTCTTTTSFLAEKLRERGKQVFIVSNKLSKKDVAIANEILQVKKLKTTNHEPQTIRIGYFSGGSSHNKDFATVTEALMRIMEKYPNVQLFLAGPLDIESALNKFKDRIEQLPYVAREKHFENLAGVDINIAPLEIGNPFCEAKSELKFFEAAIVKVPTIAAATQPFREAITDGVDGFVANGTNEWIEKLEKLITDKTLRASMAEKAYQKALEKYFIENSNNEEYYEYLESKIKNS
jgi:glycosyltransferase involved in cell wall biosynthesis